MKLYLSSSLVCTMLILINLAFLITADDNDLFAKLKQFMENKEKKNEEQIRKFELDQYDDMRGEITNQTVNDINTIYELSIEVFDNLAKTQKQDLITGLENCLKFIGQIQGMLKSELPKTELGKWIPVFLDEIAELFKEGFTAVLNKAQGKPYNPVDLEKFLDTVYKFGGLYFTTWDKLEAQGEGSLKYQFEEALGIKLKLLNSLDELKPITIPGKMILALIKSLWKKFVAFDAYYAKSM